jgi:hypothetical protein
MYSKTTPVPSDLKNRFTLHLGDFTRLVGKKIRGI